MEKQVLRKRILYGVLITLITAVIVFALYLNSLLPIITGYAAKNLCSAVFISNRDPQDVEATDLNFSFIKLTKNSVNFNKKSVTSRFLWGKSKAIYRTGFGVTLLRDIQEEELRTVRYPAGAEAGYSQDTIKWPLGDIFPDEETGIDSKKLGDITNRLITENEYNGNAYAFMVLLFGYYKYCQLSDSQAIS